MFIIMSWCSQIKSYKDWELRRCSYNNWSEFIVWKPYAKYDNQVYFYDLDNPVSFKDCWVVEKIK